MNLVAYTVLSSLLAFFVYEDFKHRAISVWALIALLCMAILYSANFIALKEIASNSFWIAFFLGVQFGLLELYYFLKRRQIRTVINDMIGVGDILFLFAIAPLFSPVQYILSYVAGLIFVLIAYAMIKQWIAATIPMAGLYSLYILLLLFIGRIAHHSWCSDADAYDLLNRYL